MKSITLRPAKKMCRASAHLFAAALLVSSTVAYAYLPIHWNDKFAARDPECSDLIILGRVVQLERGPALTVEERDTYDIVTYGIYAELAVGRALKGEELIEKNRRVRLPLGYTSVRCDSEIPHACETVPTSLAAGPRDSHRVNEIYLANTQYGFDLRMNEVYLLFLSRQWPLGPEEGEYWIPRCGPFSIGWVQYLPRQAGEEPDNRPLKQGISFGSIGNLWSEPKPLAAYIDELEAALAANEGKQR